ncbi:MAG: hypothetical protein K1X88_27280 [Nannocystaceae bacterium]|nr:hypothetical protein [Nannocystaceae bacterium]
MRRVVAIVLALSGCRPAAPSAAPAQTVPAVPRRVPAPAVPAGVQLEPSPQQAAAPVVATPPVAGLDLAPLSGSWSGTYLYDAGSGRPPVVFFAELVLGGEQLRGTMVEPNTFGDDTSGELHAALQGTIDRELTVTFTKRYDGRGGVAHEVVYIGKLDLAARRIEGTWSTEGASGRFVLARDSALPQLARRTLSRARATR